MRSKQSIAKYEREQKKYNEITIKTPKKNPNPFAAAPQRRVRRRVDSDSMSGGAENILVPLTEIIDPEDCEVIPDGRFNIACEIYCLVVYNPNSSPKFPHKIKLNSIGSIAMRSFYFLMMKYVKVELYLQRPILNLLKYYSIEDE